MSVFTFLAQTKASSLPSLAGGRGCFCIVTMIFIQFINECCCILPATSQATPDSCWPVVRGDIPGTAGWCMRLSSSTDSGRGATNIAFPCHFLEYYVHTSLLLLFPPAHPLSSLPSSPPQFSFPPHTRLLMYTNINHNNNGYWQ